MIPNQVKNNTAQNNDLEQESNVGTFAFFDVNFFIRKLIGAWYWFVIMVTLGYFTTYFYTRYFVQNIYESKISLSITKDAAGYFTPNQSINFIWGRNSNNDAIYLKRIILSRSHNEFLVKKLKLYYNYTTKGKLKTTYLSKADSPVFLEIDENHPQQVGLPIIITPKGGDKYEISFPEKAYFSTSLYDYRNETFVTVPTYKHPQKVIMRIGQTYTSPNLKFKLNKNPNPPLLTMPFIAVTLQTVNQSVDSIIPNLSVDFDKELGNIMIISKKGYNLNETIDFLNTSVDELIKKRILDEQKIDRNTLTYVNENINKFKQKIDSAAKKLDSAKVVGEGYNLDDGVKDVLDKINVLEKQKVVINDKIADLQKVKKAVQQSRFNDLITLPDSLKSLASGINEIKELYETRKELQQIYTPHSMPIVEINQKISDAKGITQLGLNTLQNNLTNQIRKIDNSIYKFEHSLSDLPDKQRRFLEIKRTYTIIEDTYNMLLNKQSEIKLRLATATGKSVMQVIDPAKNIGQGPVGPDIAGLKKKLLIGPILIPFLIILVRVLLDNRIRNIKELVKVSKIPLMGVIGASHHHNNLDVIDNPKSSISEAFRGIRSNISYLYNDDGNAKVILVTSSVGGEGKTYNAINIASTLGASGKKTILLGMDLRKPKIFGDFNFNNQYGVSSYLVGKATLEEIINHTSLPALDVITAGPIPPNPSELLMSEKNINLIKTLKNYYDFIVIDSPPVGLVADSFELMKYSDVNIYVVRHEYTEKYMLKMIIEKYAKKEVKHLGLVYNDYQVKQGYGYGYGYGYFEEDKNYKEPTLIKIRNNVKRFLRIK